MSEYVAGRELDALIAERVMGRTVTHPPQSSPGYYLEWESVPEVSEGHARELPRYSVDIAAAWEVVAKLRGDWRFMFQETPGRQWRAAFNSHRWCALVFREVADTAPLAICRAALAAVGTP